MAVFFMDAGKAITTNLVTGLGGTVPKYLGIGTGVGPASSAATALTTEVETRSGTNAPTRVTTTVTNDTFQCIQTITATLARTITECGFFDAVSAGNMFLGANNATVGPFTLAIGDSLQVTGKLTYS